MVRVQSLAPLRSDVLRAVLFVQGEPDRTSRARSAQTLAESSAASVLAGSVPRGAAPGRGSGAGARSVLVVSRRGGAGPVRELIWRARWVVAGSPCCGRVSGRRGRRPSRACIAGGT